MVGLCVGLNLTTGQKEGMANLIVNAVMFLIVGLIFLSCERNCFLPMNRIIEDLEEASEKIRNDAMNSHQFLWEPYNNSKVELFQEPRLRQQFQDYLFELNRIDNTEKAYYKCDIGDYINTGLVDSVMHRNILNQVAGVMTGLGILGTFIGLSLGLQHFSTGTTAEVTNSIAPLMDGIKVAFHTSIYGMVFSLVFNFTYKCKLEEAEDAVEEFLDVYKKYVLPDTTTDGITIAQQLRRLEVANQHYQDKIEYPVLKPRKEFRVATCEKSVMTPFSFSNWGSMIRFRFSVTRSVIVSTAVTCCC